MIIYGWYEKAVQLANAGINKCPDCGAWTAFSLHRHSHYFTLYFIPVLRYNSKFFTLCASCENGTPVNTAEKQRILQQALTLPNSAHMIQIWNTIAAAAHQLDQAQHIPGMQPPSLTETLNTLKTKFRAEDVDYVARAYTSSIADELEAPRLTPPPLPHTARKTTP